MTSELALGAQRLSAMEDLAARIAAMRADFDAAGTVEFRVNRIQGEDVARWRQTARRHENWVAVGLPDTDDLWAVDDAVEARSPEEAAQAVFYPQLHSRMVAWWLSHTWRTVDLAEAALEGLHRWRVGQAAVSARALLEEVACFQWEASRVAGAWSQAKELPADRDRPFGVSALVAPVLDHAQFGSRLSFLPERLKKFSVHVNDYVRALKKATGSAVVTEWYDWLSDASHPAFASRIAFSPSSGSHVSKAVSERYLCRAALMQVSAEGSTYLNYELAKLVADVAIGLGSLGTEVARQSLRIVDDFGLTTEAARLTRREYWRNFLPVRGNRDCPCGAGKVAMCTHRWGGLAVEWACPDLPQSGAAHDYLGISDRSNG